WVPSTDVQTVQNVQTPKPIAKYHTVSSGQTLSSISRKYGVSVAQIKQWNHLHNDVIRVGQRLIIRP
ncbi:MAG: LysM peptidoglycan-binding domain-containing protein, partial [Bacteroidia bacterium]